MGLVVEPDHQTPLVRPVGMQIKLSIAVLALVPLLSVASPTPSAPPAKLSVAKRRSFTDEDGVVDAEGLFAHVADGQAKISRGFASYKATTGKTHPSDNGYIPTTRRRIVNKRATGKVPLQDEHELNETLWQGNVAIGTPQNSFTVDFDTGSSFFVLPGPKCAASCLGHNIYDPRASNTSRDKGWRFSRGVGSQGASVDGEVYDDTLSIAGLVAMNQSLVVASHYSAQLAKSNFPSDGILGLAFEALSENVRPPVFQSLVEQGQTDRPVFGVTLLDGGGELFLGGTDTTAFDGPLTFADLVVKDPPGFWEISVDAVKVGNATVVSQPHNAIVDTGAPLFLVDMDTVNTIYGAIEGSLVATALAGPGTWTVPCDNVPTDISIVIGGKAFALSPETINTGPLRKGSNRCLGGIVGQAQNQPWVLGDVFLRNVYSEFDYGNLRVGFAPVNA